VPLESLIAPLGLVLGSLAVGFILDRVVLVRLRRFAARTRGRGEDALSLGLRGAVVLWFVLAGIYFAAQTLPISGTLLSLVVEFIRLNYIISITWVVMSVATQSVAAYLRRSDGVIGSTTIFINLTRIVIAAVGILIVLQAVGVPITPALTTFGVGGIAVALALQDTLANIFSGLYIIVSRKIQPGDYVKLASGEEGAVHDINWRNTTLQSPTNNMVIVPNSTMASVVVTNFTLYAQEVAVPVGLGVGYSADLDQVEQIAIDVARSVQRDVAGAVVEFEPLVRFGGFGEVRVNFTVIMRAKKHGEQFLMIHELIKRLHRRFLEEQIEMDVPVALREAEDRK